VLSGDIVQNFVGLDHRRDGTRAGEVHVSAKSLRKRSSWLARLWVAAALLLIVGGALTVLYNLALISNPITQQIAPGLEESAGIGAEAGALRDFNLLLISMDTTRADHLHAYGHLGVRTPNLDGLAAHGVLFSQAITPSPSTLPAHSTLMTGLYPIHHGARANGTFRLSDEAQTLAETLRAAGYRTGAAISAFVLDGRFGLPQGFDDYDDDLTHGIKHSAHMFRERPAELTNEAVFAWLDAHDPSEKFFYWVHYFDPHAAYLPPEPYRSQYAQDRYSGEISYGDAQIGRLLEKLEALGVRDRTLVVFAADHGEGLGEHGEMTHAMLIYDATLRVPMIFSAPPPFPQGVVVSAQTSLIDVMPTVLDLLGVAAPPGLDGRSLRGPAPAGPRPLYIENLSTQVLHGWAPLLGVRRDDYKFIHAPKPEIYDLRNDPGELENLYDTHPVLAAEMQEQLRAFVDDDPYMGTAAQQNLPLDPETEELLRSLGYVFTAKGTAPATPDSYQLDPKDMVVHWEKVQTAVHQHMQGEVAESIRGFEEALAEVPDDIWARHVLASAYRTYGEYEKAYEMNLSIEQRQPDDAGTVASVGSSLLQLGRVEEAEEKLKRALELDPRSGSARLGLAQIAQRRRDEVRALALLDEVIEIDPGSSGPAAYVAIGRLKLRKRELEPAREAFRAALEIDRMHAGAYDGLADVLIEEGEPDAALPYLETALRFQPAQPATLTTLAQIYRDRGELDRAIELSERALEMSPKFAAAYNNLGRIHRKRGDDETAFEMYDRAIEYAPRFDAAHVNRAQLLLASGREDEAIDAFREALRANPFNYIALANLGVREFKDGALRKSAALFARAIRVREDYALAHKYLGLLYAEFDDPAASVRHLERSLELDDAQPEVEKMRFLLGEMKKRVTRDS
jgi:arylsulfatase A-like enzyme/tetratricopeptide (TPR) repeat protein